MFKIYSFFAIESNSQNFVRTCLGSSFFNYVTLHNWTECVLNLEMYVSYTLCIVYPIWRAHIVNECPLFLACVALSLRGIIHSLYRAVRSAPHKRNVHVEFWPIIHNHIECFGGLEFFLPTILMITWYFPPEMCVSKYPLHLSTFSRLRVGILVFK